jgi:hypothetical protein
MAFNFGKGMLALMLVFLILFLTPNLLGHLPLWLTGTTREFVQLMIEFILISFIIYVMIK